MIVFGERADQHAIRQAWRELGDARRGQPLVEQIANSGTGGQEEAEPVNKWRPAASIMPLRKSA